MDPYNTFHTRITYRWMRLDYLALLLALVAAVLAHAREVRWGRFALAFAWIDVVGTLPAWYVYYLRRHGAHRSIPPVLHTLYNLAHSFVTQAVVIGLWLWAHGSWEWAMLAAPIHLCGDRSLFGNVYKPPGLSFEPVPHPGYARFLLEHERAGRW
ncbi:MAG TPA: hypothetical protein VH877_28850 [Polyangia bacterium]|jgi:hypothetical protein|nr:hypothetical protein [Polyangia bacterium]